MKKVTIFITIMSLFLLVSCSKPNEIEKNKNIELLSDTKFQNGFTISPADNEPQPDNRYPLDYDLRYTDNKEPISWLVGIPGNRFGFADEYALTSKKVERVGKDYIIEDTSKKMIINDSGKLTLELNASKEYLKPRESKEAWPHLLLQQGLKEAITLESVNSIDLTVDIEMNKLERHMTNEEYNENLHAAQFLMYIVMQSRSSLDAGNYIWFGIPFFDSRYKYLPENGMYDAGTAGNTGQFIYQMPQQEFMPNGLPLNEKVKINVDIVPYISRALVLANEKGALTNSTLADLYLTNMNIGYEIPGTFDISISIENFSLMARKK